jgi:hypothetical protein
MAGFAVWTGAQGSQGSQGAQGTVGSATNTGAQGVQGTQGFTGYAGYAVWTGAQGYTGSQGVQGTQGATGTVNIVNQNPVSGFTADFNNVYYRSSAGTLNYSAGFIQPAGNFTLSSGYIGQPLTIQSAAASVAISGSFMDSNATAGTTGTTLTLSATNAIVSLVYNGTRWVLMYRSASVAMT